MNSQNFEWQQFDELPQAKSIAHLAQQAQGHTARASIIGSVGKAQRNRLYELGVAFVLIYTLIGFLVWQRSEQRMADVEAEIGLLRSGLSTPHSLLGENELGAAAKERSSPHATKSQWQALHESIETYLRLKHEIGPSWRLQPSHHGQRLAIQQPALNQTLVPASLNALETHDDTHPEMLARSYRQNAVAPLFIEFIVSEYDDAQLTILLDAFPQHEDWVTLAPALFEQSAAEFEAAWHEYLKHNYVE